MILFSSPTSFRCKLFNECGAAVWGTSLHASDSLEFHARWGILSQDVRDVEVVWSPVHRDALGRLLLEQIQVLVVLAVDVFSIGVCFANRHLHRVIRFFAALQYDTYRKTVFTYFALIKSNQIVCFGVLTSLDLFTPYS